MGLQSTWGPIVALYLFLAGTGAGAYLVGAASGFLGERFKCLIKPGVLLGTPLVAIGCVLLLIDLGAPTRFIYAMLNPGSSMMSVGVIILCLFMVVNVIHIVMLLKGKLNDSAQRLMGVLGVVVSLATAMYTGLLLAAVTAVPFWNQPLLPILFLLSSASTGIGALFLALKLTGRQKKDESEVVEAPVAALHTIGRVDILLIALELVALFSMMFVMGSEGTVAGHSVAYLISGGGALAFWLGVVVIGLAVPVVLELVSLKKTDYSALTNIALLSGVFILVGGAVLRFVILAAGANVSLFM